MSEPLASQPPAVWPPSFDALTPEVTYEFHFASGTVFRGKYHGANADGSLSVSRGIQIGFINTAQLQVVWELIENEVVDPIIREQPRVERGEAVLVGAGKVIA